MILGLALWLVLFLVGGLLLAFGLLTLILAPFLATRVAATATASRPRLARRASGPERMRNLIKAQRTERQKRTTLSTTLTRSGAILAGAAMVCLIGGLVALVAGY